MAAELAITELSQDNSVSGVKKRASVGLEIKGHLFDKAILNRLFDLAVDTSCEFRVFYFILFYFILFYFLID